MTDDPPREFVAAFDPDRFAADGARVVALLRDHLAAAQARTLTPVSPRLSPKEAVAAFPPVFEDPRADDERDGAVVDAIARALSASLAIQSPRCVGHQVAAPLPAAALCDLAASLLNNGMAVFETGPAATAMERAVLGFFARALGLPDTAGGVLTSGGSLGNLTALLAARQAVRVDGRAADVWRRGLRGSPQLVVFVGETAHYSLARACRILGLGDAGCVSVGCDDALRMDPAALATALDDAARRKHVPVAVVASAGSTTAGAIDPIAAIADVCAARGVWLHVDGAQGGMLALSPTRRALLAGVERADSVVLDAHKTMLMPALATAVLFKDAAAGAAAFAQDAGYLFHDDDAGADVGRRTVECTKRMIALKLYACLQAYGPAFFGRSVDRVCELATFLAADARRRGFDVLVQPELDIVCFRPRGLDGGQVAAVRRRVLDDGRFYLVSVRRPDGLWLRATILHPLTTRDDLRALLDEVENASYGARAEESP